MCNTRTQFEVVHCMPRMDIRKRTWWIVKRGQRNGFISFKLKSLDFRRTMLFIPKIIHWVPIYYRSVWRSQGHCAFKKVLSHGCLPFRPPLPVYWTNPDLSRTKFLNRSSRKHVKHLCWNDYELHVYVVDMTTAVNTTIQELSYVW